MFVDASTASTDVLYKILIGSVVPRPIAWVSTLSSGGVANLAPFSFFNVVSSNPPMLAFSVGLKWDAADAARGIPKDTLLNVRDNGEFVVNIVSRGVAELMNQTSAEYPANVSEFDAVGLTRIPSQMVRPPRVGESLIQMECRLHQIIEFGTNPGAGNLVIGEILCFHIDDSVYRNGHIAIDVLQPVGRLAGSSYINSSDRFELARPRVAP
jgi:flavin reductase (DIM6/NTAB) family NADH-FMN oxidoreductase RutF